MARLITWANDKGTKNKVANIRTVIGLMSGTSMDGIDVALLRTDGHTITEFGAFRTYPFSAADRAIVETALQAARAIGERDERPPPLAVAEELITSRHISAVDQFIADFSIDRAGLDAVGFHGQTVFHDPARALTVQIGDGQALANALGIPTVWDMRAADMAAGGQGAPLAPVFHRAMAEYAKIRLPAVILNIGGVANLTWIGQDGALVAFDCGPGNALLDDWIRLKTGERFDRDGAVARTGSEPDPQVIDGLLSDAYFQIPPPKSLDRDHFSVPGLEQCSLADGARLLTRFSAASIIRSTFCLPAAPEVWVATGGGRRNSFMMQMIGSGLEGTLVSAEDYGFDGDAVEAQAFGFLAVRTLNNLPLTYPDTTGVRSPLPGGRTSLPIS